MTSASCDPAAIFRPREPLAHWRWPGRRGDGRTTRPSRLSTIRAARGSTGIAHAVGNSGVLAMSAVSLALRLRGPRDRVPAAAMGLTAGAAGLLAVTGWLGGEMAFRERIDVIPDDRQET
ncbi:MAG: DUF2231 domain-containing protein [Candidatus Limnocylindria bacterium]